MVSTSDVLELSSTKNLNMINLQKQDLDLVYGGTGDEEDLSDFLLKKFRNLSRATRGFLNGFFYGDNCHCY